MPPNAKTGQLRKAAIYLYSFVSAIHPANPLAGLYLGYPFRKGSGRDSGMLESVKV
jgi:hypothetical protein